ncbi:MAG: prolipoprotein diacylglyceryl transferase [Clostridia bacterium]|nr:prolipoprotein diacylglyceryl transferase [Clostridia bacterium]
MTVTQVSFPGIFGDTVFAINPVAISAFGLEIRWYGLIICIGIILTVMNVIRVGKREGLTTDDVLDYALWVVPCGIIGARAYYVLTSLSEYKSFLEAIAIWNGGLAIYGGIIGGAIAALAVSLAKKIRFVKIADAIGASIFIGQMIGRWGNFCNGEAYGSLSGIDFLGKFIETPSLADSYPLRMVVHSASSYGVEVVHPTFLYESLWNLLGFIIVAVFYKKKKFDGQIILSYLGWYGFGRFFIEGLRTDSLYLGNTGIRISQLLALLTFIFAVAITVIMLARTKKEALDEGEYESQFGVRAEEATTEAEKEISAEITENTTDTNNTTEETTNGTDN